MEQAVTRSKTGTLAVIYCRVSNPKQRTQHDGLGSQETRCREFARFKSLEVVHVFTDDMSGGRTDRPGMTAMLSFLKKHRADTPAVIIDDVSRLARGVTAHWELRELIAGAGGTLVSPSIEFGEDPDAILVENMMASVSQHQRQKNAEQTKNRMRSRVLNGYWVFWPPKGYRFTSQKGGGRVLVRDEPLASIIAEGLEGFAAGRFETQVELKRFFETRPEFPKDLAGGYIRNQRIKDMLTQPLYAGYIELPSWNVPLREGRHEGLISFQTFQRIQKRLKEPARAPVKKNISADFPLRGFVLCGDCGHAMTSCWSKSKSGKRHPYYQCFNRECRSKRKSIRRADIEAAFESLVSQLQPSPGAIAIARKMFREIWEHRRASLKDAANAVRGQIAKLDGEINSFLDRIADASSATVISAYERRINLLEAKKLELQEKAAESARPIKPFEEAFQTPLKFLENPLKLWRSGDLAQRRLLLKMAFSERPKYTRGGGFPTPRMALPFRVLGQLQDGCREMARRGGFEPPTPRFVVWCSIQLSYRRRSVEGAEPSGAWRGVQAP